MDLRRIIKEEIEKYLFEDGDAGFGGATNANISAAATYDVPMGGVQRKSIYKPAEKRSKDFSNGSMMMQKAEDETEVNKKKR